MKQILIADDDEVVREMLKALLQDRYDVIVALDGKQTLKKVVELKPDLAIVDVTMPKINGWEVTKQIKSNDDLKHIKVLMLTAKDDPMDQIMGYESGADKYVVKPFDGEQIQKAVEELVSS